MTDGRRARVSASSELQQPLFQALRGDFRGQVAVKVEQGCGRLFDRSGAAFGAGRSRRKLRARTCVRLPRCNFRTATLTALSEAFD